MDNAFFVRSLEGLSDLTKDLDRLVQRHRPAGGDAIGQRLALDELHDEKHLLVDFLEPVQRCDSRMI